MHALSLIAGIACLFGVLLDSFQTVILPRRATGRFRLTRMFYILTWTPYRAFGVRIKSAKQRETYFSYYGPLSLVMLIVVWAVALILGFALLYYADHTPFTDATGGHISFLTDIYVSGTTLFTLGLGDVVPHTKVARILLISEAGTGLGFVALVIGYFPVLYGAFSRREVSISLLDARAGSPPTALELLRRHSFEGGNAALTLLLEEWERWSAELLESHLSYPLLCYFRSQHTNESWLSALTAVLDTCAVLIAGVKGHPARQAQLTFAMARHALVDLAQIFSLAPIRDLPDRLNNEQFHRLHDELCQSKVAICRDDESIARLREMRDLYEGYSEALSQHLCMALPPWMTAGPRKDNWQSVAKLRARTEAVPTPNGSSRATAVFDDEHHDF